MSTATAEGTRSKREERKVIFASSLGTVFEWYDFYLYGSLAAIVSKQFSLALSQLSRSSSCSRLLRQVSRCLPSGRFFSGASAAWWAANTPSSSLS